MAVENDALPAIPAAGLPEVIIQKGDHILWSDYYLMRHPDVSMAFGVLSVTDSRYKIWGPDAEVFSPGRHLDADGKFLKPKGPNFNAFGAGPHTW
jgi:hypothetical protein